MRRFLQITILGCLSLAGAVPQLSQVQSIYILPMGSGMDQYLANRITRMGKMQVVADPLKADTILTDHLGETFEKRLDELYLEPDEDDKSTEKDKSGVEKNQLRPSSFGRGKGTFFLVNRNTRTVVWSIYERPKNSSAAEMNRIAERVVNHIKHDLKPAQQ